MKKEEARRAVLNEYDRWAKKHPKDASVMAAFSSSDTYKKKGPAFSISVRLATSGKSFTAGFGIGWKPNFEETDPSDGRRCSRSYCAARI
jgi:hypothetical protein